MAEGTPAMRTEDARQLADLLLAFTEEARLAELASEWNSDAAQSAISSISATNVQNVADALQNSELRAQLEQRTSGSVQVNVQGIVDAVSSQNKERVDIHGVKQTLHSHNIDVWVRSLSEFSRHMLTITDNPYAGRDIIAAFRSLYEHKFSALLWHYVWEHWATLKHAASDSSAPSSCSIGVASKRGRTALASSSPPRSASRLILSAKLCSF